MRSDMRCDRCKWWATAYTPHSLLPIDGFGRCQLADMEGSLYTADGLNRRHPQSKAVAEDCEGYQAFLITAADFGCIQYEASDA